jgi:hypothetical protein
MCTGSSYYAKSNNNEMLSRRLLPALIIFIARNPINAVCVGLLYSCP